MNKFACVLAVFGCVIASHGETIWVCPNGSCDFSNVQAAIDYAKDGDVIEIAAGTYPLDATVNPHGKSILLRGEFGRDGSPLSILDGQGALRVLECTTNETHETSFEHLAFINGNATYGAGIFCQGSSPYFLNCTIKECISSSDGAGVCNISASPTMLFCVMESNQTTGAAGGGMANFSSSEPQLSYCVFYGNAASSLGGGGLFNSTCNPTLMNCRFEVNTTPGRGGGMHNEQSDPLLTDCSFIANTAGYRGGGIYNNTNCKLTLQTCLFDKNVAEDGGGGVFNYLASPDIDDCFFFGNSVLTGDGGAIANQGDPDWQCLASITNCVFESNVAENRGGAIHNATAVCQPTIQGCEFRGNAAGIGSSIANELGALSYLQTSIFAECCSVDPITTAIDFGGNNSLYICEGCEGDVNCDGAVTASDLARLLSAWGPSIGRYDLNADGVVNGLDISHLLVTWGPCS